MKSWIERKKSIESRRRRRRRRLDRVEEEQKVVRLSKWQLILHRNMRSIPTTNGRRARTECWTIFLPVHRRTKWIDHIYRNPNKQSNHVAATRWDYANPIPFKVERERCKWNFQRIKSFIFHFTLAVWLCMACTLWPHIYLTPDTSTTANFAHNSLHRIFFFLRLFFVWAKCIQSPSPLRSFEPEGERDRCAGRHCCECVDEWNKNVCT